MKKTIAFLLALLLALMLPSAAFAEETEEMTGVEHVDYAVITPATLMTLITDELPDWLWMNILGTSANNPPPEIADQEELGNPPILQPSAGDPHVSAEEEVTNLYVPYTVIKTVTYYDKEGVACYALTLRGVFVNTAAGCYCLKADTDVRICSGHWRIEPNPAKINGDTAQVDFTVTQLFTGVPVKTQTVTLTVHAKGNGGTLPGDMDMDGDVTAADARIALRTTVGLEPKTELKLQLGDLDGDGDLTAADARLILRRAVGLKS